MTDNVVPDLSGMENNPKQILEATKAANKSINRYLKNDCRGG